MFQKFLPNSNTHTQKKNCFYSEILTEKKQFNHDSIILYLRVVIVYYFLLWKPLYYT